MQPWHFERVGVRLCGALLALALALAAPVSTGRAQSASPPAGSGPAYELSLVREGDTVAIGGVLPDTETREAVLAALRTAAADIAVLDTSEVRAGEREHFATAASLAATLVMKLKPGAVLVEGQAFSIEGRPDGAGARTAIATALGMLPQGLSVRRVTLALPVARPFAMTVRRNGTRLAVEGVTASETERAAILAALAAAAPDLPATDGLSLADGAPAGIDRVAGARLAAAILARLSTGEVRLSDATLSVDGQAGDRAGFVAAQRAVRDLLPAGVTLGAVAIRAPVVSPYRWFVEKGPAGILVQGYVPSEEARAIARAAVAGQFGALRLTDNQEIAEGAPADFAAAVAAAVKQLALLPRGRVAIEDRGLWVSGEAPSDAYASAARSAIRRFLPAGWSLSHAIGSPPPVAAARPAVADSCSPKIRDEMAAGGIVFQFGRETMRPDSIARLRRIAAIMKECPQTRFSVEGHTDSDGIPDQNVDLSQRRAQAVVSLLIRQGIEAGRLLAEGHGASRPLVPNDSTANKARNRRIEFVTR
jgi:OOP family OmpA-OmpF porin